jgi:hypothetical protein
MAGRRFVEGVHLSISRARTPSPSVAHVELIDAHNAVVRRGASAKTLFKIVSLCRPSMRLAPMRTAVLRLACDVPDFPSQRRSARGRLGGDP